MTIPSMLSRAIRYFAFAFVKVPTGTLIFADGVVPAKYAWIASIVWMPI